MDLRMYHGKRISVVVSRFAVQRVFFGVAAYEDDEDLGPVLRVSLQQDGGHIAGDPAFIVQEDAAAACLVADDRYGCDFCLYLGMDEGRTI